MKILLCNHISCPNNLIMKKENSCLLSDQAAIKQKVLIAEWIKKNYIVSWVVKQMKISHTFSKIAQFCQSVTSIHH